MKGLTEFVKATLVGGLLVILPVALIVILLRRAAAILDPIVQPVMSRLPEGIPFPGLIALSLEIVLIVLVCALVGLVVRTAVGRRIVQSAERRIFEKLPGYRLLRSLTRRAAGEAVGIEYSVALVDMEEGLVPAFIIEQHPDGRYTVIAPTVPPTSGNIYIFTPDKVHPVDVPVSTAMKIMTRFGQDSGELLRRMRPQGG